MLTEPRGFPYSRPVVIIPLGISVPAGNEEEGSV
jgi:hypothetical protein